MQLKNMIATPFHRHYKGGLIKWVQDYENAFAELATLGEKAWSDDNAKKRRLINNAQNLDIASSFKYAFWNERANK